MSAWLKSTTEEHVKTKQIPQNFYSFVLQTPANALSIKHPLIIFPAVKLLFKTRYYILYAFKHC